jgi:hypothetical protein
MASSSWFRARCEETWALDDTAVVFHLSLRAVTVGGFASTRGWDRNLDDGRPHFRTARPISIDRLRKKVGCIISGQSTPIALLRLPNRIGELDQTRWARNIAASDCPAV